MKRVYGIVVVSLVMLLPACASKNWSHATNGEREFHRDKAQCMDMSRSGGGANNQINRTVGSGFANGFSN